jgi:hypothetical protein
MTMRMKTNLETEIVYILHYGHLQLPRKSFMIKEMIIEPPFRICIQRGRRTLEYLHHRLSTDPLLKRRYHCLLDEFEKVLADVANPPGPTTTLRKRPLTSKVIPFRGAK